MKVLFVCTGNTCRSPMAQAIAQKHFPDIAFDSAGISAACGMPASENAVAALQEIGIELAGHRSKQLTRELCDAADMIVPMTVGHRDILLALGIDSEKVSMLARGVSDPYGGDIEAYRACRDELAELIDGKFKELC